MTFADFIDEVGRTDLTLTVLNRQEVAPVQELFERFFDFEHVTVREDVTADGRPADLVVLTDGDGEIHAASSLGTVRDSVLMVNSDLYITGTRSLAEVDTPDVVAGLADTAFETGGKQKFLLIQLSRHIEAMALGTGRGALHSGFQELSRIDAEYGTHQAYRRLAEIDVDVHVYGRSDWDPPAELDVTAHTAETGELTESWFVVYDGGGVDPQKAALVAVETGPNEYEGFWTFDPAVVDDVLTYVEERYLS